MTFTLNRPWSNLDTPHHLIILDICAVICKSHQGIKSYRADMKYSHTVKLRLRPWPWSNIGTAHRFIILNICAMLFVNPTRGSKDYLDIERTWKFDGRTDNGAKTYVSPFHGRRHNSTTVYCSRSILIG